MRKLFCDSIRIESELLLKNINDYAQCGSIILKSCVGSLVEIFDHIESDKTVRIAIEK